jgi:hypothetical protein
MLEPWRSQPCRHELVSVEQYSLGKSLTLVKIFQLATLEKASLLAVLTDRDVVVEGLCSLHDTARRGQSVRRKIRNYGRNA